MNEELAAELALLAVQSGKFDESLDALKATINARQGYLAEQKATEMTVGDHLIIGNCSPKKYNGQMAQFIGREKNWLKVRLGNGTMLRIRASHVQHVIK